MKILDLFCSNGSTWIDKTYFCRNVLKNDIRNGSYIKGENTHKPQTIVITPDIQFDVLNQKLKPGDIPIHEVVYADPPHIVNATGIMFETYGTLFDNWRDQLDNLFYNLNLITGNVLIFKWNDRSISSKNIIKEASKYFVPGIKFELPKTHNTSFMLIFFKK